MNRSTQVLLQRYIFGLALIVAIILVGQVVTQVSINQQDADAAVINISGRQRMLSQRLTKNALLFIQDSTSLYRDQLIATRDLWKSSHEGLQFGDDTLGLPGTNSPIVIALYADIAEHYQAMLVATSCLLEESDCSQQAESYLSDILANEGDFLTGMNTIVFQYAAEADARVQQARLIQGTITVLVVLVLVGQAFLVFRPALLEVQQTQINLENLLEKLRKTSANLRAMLDSAKQTFTLIDRNARVVAFDNGGAQINEEIFGKPLREGANIYDYVLERDFENFKRNYHLALEGKIVTIEQDFEGKDAIYYFESSLYPIIDIQGDILGVCMSTENITERKLAVDALRESEEKYRLLVEYSHQGMVIAQANPTRIRFASQPMQTIIGYTPDELTRFTPDQIIQLIHPEDRQGFFATFRARLAGDSIDASARYRLIHKSGDIRHLDLNSSRIDYEGESAIQSAFLDVTEQIEAERLKARFQKEQEQNVLVQHVVSMLSHDLRTPLAIIASSRDILHRYFDRLSDEARAEKLDTISRQVHFVTELLDDAVNTVREPLNQREFIPNPLHLAVLCQISVDEVKEAQDSNHNIEFVNKGAVETVSVDEVLVSRILANLLSNAIKYSPVDSKIHLELDRSEDWIILRVSDQGEGIGEHDLLHIFDPFYRADGVEEVEGTGLGLNIVKDCVDRHKGRIHVESKLGQGSTFTVELPRI